MKNNYYFISLFCYNLNLINYNKIIIMEEENNNNYNIIVPKISEFEKKPDNPNFSHVKLEEKQYIEGLQQQVLQMKRNCPEKYNKAQSIGESYMNCKYELERGIDDEGDEIKARLILYSVRDYLLDDKELSNEELNLLTRRYGENWRNKIVNL